MAIFMIDKVLTDGFTAVKYTGQYWHSGMMMSEISGERMPLTAIILKSLQQDQERKLKPCPAIAEAASEGSRLRRLQMPKIRRGRLTPIKFRKG